MPNKKDHMFFGAVVGAVISGASYYRDCRSNRKSSNREPAELSALFVWMGAGAVTGSLVATLPDILESPTHPNHRQFFHSLVFFLLIIIALYYILDRRSDMPAPLKMFIAVAVAGYNSHLFVDANTPLGLPLLGK